MASSTSTSGSESPGGAIRARLYDGRGTTPREVTLAWQADDAGPSLLLQPAAGASAATLRQPLASLRIGERVGVARRFVELPGGASLEIVDNDGFDALLAAARHRPAGHRVRRLERHWRHALAAVLAVVLLSWVMLRYGAPALASRAVAVLPTSLDAQVGAGTLELLDRSVFKPSALPAARQARLHELFAAVAEGRAPPGQRLRLELRRGGRVGPNAFALPSGTVVLTDELEALARHDDELRAVFAHEIGHVTGRHAMRMLLQQSGAALLAVALFGDVGSATGLVSAAPTVLVNAAYSRDLEREADEYAFRWMAEDGVSPRRLGELLARVEKSQGGGGRGGYLASHPDITERVRAGERAAQRPGPDQASPTATGRAPPGH